MILLLQKIFLPLADFPLELDVEIQNQVTAIFGPSGAGKTSLLDLIAGLRRPKSAFIQLGDRVLTDAASPNRLRAAGPGIVPTSFGPAKPVVRLQTQWKFGRTFQLPTRQRGPR